MALNPPLAISCIVQKLMNILSWIQTELHDTNTNVSVVSQHRQKLIFIGLYGEYCPIKIKMWNIISEKYPKLLANVHPFNDIFDIIV